VALVVLVSSLLLVTDFIPFILGSTVFRSGKSGLPTGLLWLYVLSI
jgi:hypothetical protein